MKAFKKYLIEYKKGDIVVEKGKPHDYFYIVHSGRVQLIGDNNIPLAKLSKGDFFGEECVDTDQDTVYAAQMAEDGAVIKLPLPVLKQIMKKNQEISYEILKKLSRKNSKIIKGFSHTGTILDQTNKIRRAGQVPTTGESYQRLDPDVTAYITIKQSNRRIRLYKTTTLLGRYDKTSGFSPDIDLSEEDQSKYVSRRHAKISYIEGKFYISSELSSINKTFLNGKRLNPGIKYELHKNDTITLCNYDLTFD